MDHQSKPEPQPAPQLDSSDTKRGGGLGWILWPLITLLFYIFSIGPVAKLSGLSYPNFFSPRMEAFYAPVFYICRKSTAADNLLIRYLLLWRVSFPVE